MILRLQSAISLFTCSCVISMASATSSNIGLVMSTGDVEVDGLRVPGTSAIFSGNLISSGDRSSSLQFSDGTSAIMKPGATVTVYRERSVLRQGVTVQRGVDKHAVLADGLRISGATANAAVLVGVRDLSHVEVAAQEGESDVWNSTGNLIARVEPGKTLSFGMNEAAGAPANGVEIFGILQPHYLLKDQITSVTYQLRGADLEPLVGTSVQVTGTVLGSNPSSSTPEVVAVSNIMPYAAMGGGGQAAPSTNGGGIKKGVIVLLIFVAFGATLIGLGASGSFGVSTPPVTPATP